MAVKQRVRPSGVVMVLCATVSYEASAALAVTLFPRVGPLGMATLRIGLAAVVLMIAVRPEWRGHSRRDWGWILEYGLTMTAMNSLFYLALDRIALGAAVTIETVGPLVLSVVLAHRKAAAGLAALAFAGVVLLREGAVGRLDAAGIALALGAGACWAGYIVGSRQVGKAVHGLDGLTLAMVVGTVAVAPFGIWTAGASLARPSTLGLGLIVAIGSSALPYALEMIALRRIPAALFSILESLAPVAATASGLIFLRQHLAPLQLLGVACVIAASALATWLASRPR
ncbi:MAG: EamA family transporter [Bifidobacteriaceae bacterium]|nr:EamA family transporter [Bifidobacteriaceae bacterium]